jgi:hypothetical protein
VGFDCTQRYTARVEPLDIFKGALTVALITVLMRWLSLPSKRDQPQSHGGSTVYPMKLKIRVAAYAFATLCTSVSFMAFRDASVSCPWAFAVPGFLLAIFGVWFGTGMLVTDGNGISKRSLWNRQMFRWEEISSVDRHDRDGGSVVVKSKNARMIIDSRFAGHDQLLRDIKAQTELDHTAPPAVQSQS